MPIPVGLTYSTYVAELAVLCQFNPTDPNFLTNIPSALNYAQDRIHRELNLTADTQVTGLLPLTAGNRHLDITSLFIDAIYDVNVITPASAPTASEGTRNPLTISTKEYLTAVYGSGAVLGQPSKFAIISPTILIFGPWPDQNYPIELVGQNWVDQLTATNTTTWVSTYLPELLLAASMIWMTGFMKNFGAQSDDPRSAVSWETQYASLRDSAMIADLRRKFQSTGWTSELPSPAASPRT
jgi:hypothetical protein